MMPNPEFVEHKTPRLEIRNPRLPNILANISLHPDTSLKQIQN
jgi:hypothetical protein